MLKGYVHMIKNQRILQFVFRRQFACLRLIDQNLKNKYHKYFETNVRYKITFWKA